MKTRPLYYHYQYVGILAEIFERFVAEKRAVGYLYNSEAQRLHEFSRFSLGYAVPLNSLPQELVEAWLKRRPNDSDRNYHSRYALLKLVAEFMQRLGYDAYCPSRADLGKINWQYTPYIFSHNEIHNFFFAANKMRMKNRTISKRRHIIMPVIFKLLYCCGLRLSETLSLKVEDVSLTDGVLTIHQSKFGKSRYVPMSPEMTTVCRIYASDKSNICSEYFFTAPDGGRYDNRGVYSTFREVLWNAGISHGGKGKGPRLHDFRHTFAVHSLEKIIRSGKDLTAALPKLSAYLGHVDLSATEKYLRLTAEVYPDIIALLDEKYGHIFPEGGAV